MGLAALVNPLWSNSDEEFGKKLMQKYKIENVPALVFLRSDGTVVKLNYKGQELYAFEGAFMD